MKKSFFGYNKKQVSAYINYLMRRMKELEKENERLLSQKKELEEELKEKRVIFIK